MKGFFEFPKGVSIAGHKERTEKISVVEGPSPGELIFPMTMHTGEPARVRVRVGDVVKAGTLIGEAPDHVSANIHSSISGTVKAVEERETFSGPARSVIIENNGRYDEERHEPLNDGSTMEQFLARLSDCGLIGLGGAGFPTHVKFSPSDKGHRYMLINGVECEPFATADHRVMLEHPGEILRTIELLRRLFKTELNVVAIEDDKDDAIALLRKRVRELGYSNIQIKEVGGRYPQGYEGVLIGRLLGLEIPQGAFPNKMGILSSNVSTIKAIHDALFLGQPLTRRVITVTGPIIANPRNVLARVGTPVQDLIDFCGGFTEEAGKMINGGPMMGLPFDNPRAPVVKSTTMILCLGADARTTPQERACIRCARCIDVCPVNMQPILISNAFRSGRIDLCKVLKSESCIRCGCCTFICPSRIPLLEDIKSGIRELKDMQGQPSGTHT